MKKKLISILLFVALVMGLLPATALAADPTTGVCIGGVVLEAGEYYINGATTAVATEPANWNAHLSADGTLTINNLSVMGVAGEHNGAAIYSPVDLTIKLVGANSVIGADTTTGDSAGIYVDGALTINGDGALTATGGAAANSYGIAITTGNFTNEGGTINATAGEASSNSHGISITFGDFTNTGGSVTATGGKSTAVLDLNTPITAGSYGIYIAEGNFENSGTVEAKASEATRVSAGIGIENGDFTNYSAGTEVTGNIGVTATGSDATRNSYGIGITTGNFTNEGGTINATAGKSTAELDLNASKTGSYGIGIIIGNFKNTAGSITATGVESGNTSCGISVGVGTFENVGTIVAKSGAAGYSSIALTTTITSDEAAILGILPTGATNIGNITNSGDITATAGGTAGVYSFGIRAAGDITNNGSIEATGGSATTNGDSYGIGVTGDVTNGSDTNDAVTLTATGGVGKNSYGIGCSGDLTNYATINATGGTSTVTTNADDMTALGSFGIGLVNGALTNNKGGEIYADGGVSLNSSYGIVSSGGTIENNGKITANGGAGVNSVGIATGYTESVENSGTLTNNEGGEITAKGGTLTVSDNTTNAASVGVFVNGIVNNGTLTGEGDAATTHSFGIRGTSLNNSGILEGIGGAADESNGIRVLGDITNTGDSAAITAAGGTSTSTPAKSYGLYYTGTEDGFLTDGTFEGGALAIYTEEGVTVASLLAENCAYYNKNGGAVTDPETAICLTVDPTDDGGTGDDTTELTPTDAPTDDPTGDHIYCPQDDTCPIAPFDDSDPTAWYHDAVHYCIEHGLMNGTSDTEFEPHEPTTRAMLVTILHRMAGTPAPTTTGTFTDVAEGMWYTDAIDWAASLGIILGHGDGTFEPDSNLTREQMATILYRCVQLLGIDVSVGEDTILSFTDADEIIDWAYAALQWACAVGLYEGDGDGTLRPGDDLERCEMATLIYRLCEDILK